MRKLLGLIAIFLLSAPAVAYTESEEFTDRQKECEEVGRTEGKQTFFETMPYESTGNSTGCDDTPEKCGDRTIASCEIAQGRSLETLAILENSFAQACEQTFGNYAPSEFNYSAQGCTMINDMMHYTPAVPRDYTLPPRDLTTMFSHVRRGRGYCCRIIQPPPNYSTEALLCPDGSWASNLQTVTGVHPKQELGVNDNMSSCSHNPEQRSVLASNDYIERLASLANVCTNQGKVLLSVGINPVSCERQNPYANFGQYKCTRVGKAGCCPVYPPVISPTPEPSPLPTTSPSPTTSPAIPPSPAPAPAPSPSANVTPPPRTTVTSPPPAAPTSSPMMPPAPRY